MKNNSIVFIGLDTHKEFTEVALLDKLTERWSSASSFVR